MTSRRKRKPRPIAWIPKTRVTPHQRGQIDRALALARLDRPHLSLSDWLREACAREAERQLKGTPRA